jgi:hypothetical protein
MNNHWTTQRGQLDQALELERALRQARRRQQPAIGQTLWQGWTAVRLWLAGLRQATTHTTLRAPAPR